MVNIFTNPRYKVNRHQLRQLVNDFLSKHGYGQNIFEINLVFVGKIKMKRIATSYKNEPIALPVLSFFYNKLSENGVVLLGEIFICYPQAVLLAAERNKTVEFIIKDLVTHGLKSLFKQIQ